MAKKKTSSPAPSHSVDQILKELRDLRRRSSETVQKMKELEKSVEAIAQSRAR